MTTYPPIDPVKLAKLAEVAVRVGLNLKPGQEVVMTSFFNDGA